MLLLLLLISLVILSSCTVPGNDIKINEYSNPVLPTLTCSDGTLYNKCSQNKPFYCDKGKLINASFECGCPEGYKEKNDSCEQIIKCGDNTIAGECSVTKPYYCRSGGLVSEPDMCGCPYDQMLQDHVCISRNFRNPKNITLVYVLRGKRGQFNFTVYEGFNDYFYDSPLEGSYYAQEEEYVTNEQQRELLTPLVDRVKQITSNKDDQARIIISFVQEIPYDILTYIHDYSGRKYPYEVLYTMKGVCGEKSKLGAVLLKELGFSVALLSFPGIEHQTLGIKCDPIYSFNNTGYCFVEMTERSIITYDQYAYNDEGSTVFDSNLEIPYSTGGDSFETVKEEYEDVKELLRIISTADVYILERDEWGKYKDMVYKYGLPGVWGSGT